MGIRSFVQDRLARRIGPEHRSFAAMTGTVLGGTHATCPHCRRGKLMPVPGAMDLRKCDDPGCGAEYALAEMGRTFALEHADVHQLAASARREAMTLFVAAEIIGVVAAVWAVYASSWMTLIGALLLCTVICATAMVSRYRAWQLEQGRMFEARAPLGTFLRAEFDTLLRGRN